MHRFAQDSSAGAMSRVQLEGGPSGLSGTVELTEFDEVIRVEKKLKIRYLNGYEHYELDAPPVRSADEGEVTAPVTFRWTGRTKIAE